MFLLEFENRFVFLFFLAWCLFRFTEGLNKNWANFSVHHMFWLQNRPDKLLRIKWPLNDTLQYVLHGVTLTGRHSVFRLFVFLVFALNTVNFSTDDRYIACPG